MEKQQKYEINQTTSCQTKNIDLIKNVNALNERTTDGKSHNRDIHKEKTINMDIAKQKN